MPTPPLLFQPTAPGPLSLQNRIAMAPMTRSRAIGNVPNAIMRDYYGQRSGAERVGVRLSPFNPFNDLAANYDGEEAETLDQVRELAAPKIGYLHLIATPGAVPESTVSAVRAAFPGTLILAGDYTGERAESALAAGRADVIAFGRPFIGNPDLPARLQHNLELSAFDPDTLYSPGAAGYSDYPACRAEEPATA